MGERVFYPAIAGRKAQVMGNPDQPHSYSYIPDIAMGLVTLADHDEADGAAWHLPNAPSITTREFIDKIYAAAGNEPQIQAMPPRVSFTVGRSTTPTCSTTPRKRQASRPSTVMN